MSSLKAIEKRVFEDLFGMASGYVLDFSNKTFAEFFRETINIDIYAPKYAFNGDSKAKRLRVFWETEPDVLVGKVLAGLLEVWQYNAARNGQTDDSPQYKQAAGIVARLTGKQFVSGAEMSWRNRQMEFCGRGGLCGRRKRGRDHV